MARVIDRVTLAASLIAPHVALEWEEPSRCGPTRLSRAVIGSGSDVVIQSVDPNPQMPEPCGGMSAWSRARQGCSDPFPIRFWAFTRLTDAGAWAGLCHAIHHRLIVQAQAHLLLSRWPLEDALSGLRLVDVSAARHAVGVLTGRDTRARSLAGLIAELREPPRTGRSRTVRQS